MPKGWWSPASLTLTRTPASIHGFSHFFVYYTHVHVRTKEILPSPPSSGDLHQITLRASLCRKRLEGLFSSQLQCLRNRTQGKWLLLCQWANSNLPCFFLRWWWGLLFSNCKAQELNSWKEKELVTICNRYPVSISLCRPCHLRLSPDQPLRHLDVQKGLNPILVQLWKGVSVFWTNLFQRTCMGFLAAIEGLNYGTRSHRDPRPRNSHKHHLWHSPLPPVHKGCQRTILHQMCLGRALGWAQTVGYLVPWKIASSSRYMRKDQIIGPRSYIHKWFSDARIKNNPRYLLPTPSSLNTRCHHVGVQNCQLTLMYAPFADQVHENGPLCSPQPRLSHRSPHGQAKDRDPKLSGIWYISLYITINL